jgi:MFS family permease
MTEEENISEGSVAIRGKRPSFLGQKRHRAKSGAVSMIRVEVLLFLLVWFAYGVVINSDNLLKFNLQQIGVEAIVERHEFYLEGSTAPELQPLGDVFLYQGHKYAAKQPGQFMAGALVYSVLSAFGLRYVNNYLLTSALVTFLTSSLVLALSAIAVFRIARELTKDSPSLFWPMLTTFAYALATTVYPYSGIAHHDALATGYLVLAFYLVFQLSRQGRPYGRGAILASGAAGLLFGFTITTSMLAFFMVLVSAVYFISLRRWKLMSLFLAGALIGLLPLFIYDARSFGSPFLLPNVVGAHMFADTFFHFDPRNLGNKLVSYSTMILVYAPVFAVGLFGLTYYPASLKRRPIVLTLLALIGVLAVYILNITTGGDCQFGPRYLLPAMPFACLGITGFSYLSTSGERRIAGAIVVLVTSLSFVVNLVGALSGAMCCPDGANAFRNQLTSLVHRDFHSYPLAPWLLVPLAVSAVLFVWTVMRSRNARSWVS